MDGDISSQCRLPLAYSSGISKNNVLSPFNKVLSEEKIKNKIKYDYYQRNISFDRNRIAEPNSYTYFGIKTIKREKSEVSGSHTRKGSLNFKILKDKLSSHKIAKGRRREKSQRCHRKICHERKNAAAKKEWANCPSSTTSEMKRHKTNSSDLFGFRRCNQRRQNIDYNMSVIYKLLGKDNQNKNSHHETLRCRHCSFEDVTQNKTKKKSRLVKCVNEVPTRYTLINFSQCSTSSDTFMLRPKGLNQTKPNKMVDEVSSLSISNTNKSILKNADSFKSVFTQPMKIKTKQRKVATTDCPTNKSHTLRTTVANVFHPSKANYQHSKHGLCVKRYISSEQTRKNVRVSLKPLPFLKTFVKHFLSLIVVIVWLPCIVIIGLFWLISYPFRPHQYLGKNNYKKQFDRQNERREKKNKRCLDKTKSDLRTKTLSQVISRPFKISVHAHKKNIKCNVKLRKKATRKQKGAQNKTGARFFHSAITALAFPDEEFKPCNTGKKKKSVTFEESFEKCDSLFPKEDLDGSFICPEGSFELQSRFENHIEMPSHARYQNTCFLEQLKTEKPQSDCRRKKTQRCNQKRRMFEVGIPKIISKLIQSTLCQNSSANTYGNLKHLPTNDNKCSEINIEPAKINRHCNKNVGNQNLSNSPTCSEEFCRTSQVNICPAQNYSPLSKKRSFQKSVQVSTRKSTSVIKFFPLPPLKTEKTNKTKSSNEGTKTQKPSKDGSSKSKSSKESTERQKPSKDVSNKSKSSKEGIMKPKPSKDGSNKSKSPKEGIKKPKPSKDGSNKSKSPKEGIKKPKPSKDGTNKSKSPKEGIKKPKPSKDGSNKSKSPKEVIKKPKPSKDGSNKSKSPKEGIKKPKPSKDGSNKSKSPKEGIKKPKTSKDGSNKSKSSKEAIKKPKPSKNGSNKSKSPKDGIKKQKPSKDGSNKSKSSKEGSKKQKPPKVRSNKLKPSKEGSNKKKSSKNASKKKKLLKDGKDKKKPSKDGSNKKKASKDRNNKQKVPKDKSKKQKKLKDKEINKKKHAMKSTSVLKFFLSPRPRMRSVSSNVSLPSSSKETKYKTRTSSSNTSTIKTTSVVKFFPAPQQDHKASCKEDVSKITASNGLKSLKNKTKGTVTPFIKKTISIIKFFPSPCRDKHVQFHESKSIEFFKSFRLKGNEISSASSKIPKPSKMPMSTKNSMLLKTPTPSKNPMPSKTPKPPKTPKPSKTPMPSKTPKPPKTPKPSKTPMPSKTPIPSKTPMKPKTKTVVKFFPVPRKSKGEKSISSSPLPRRTNTIATEAMGYPLGSRKSTTASNTDPRKALSEKHTSVIKFFPRPQSSGNASANNKRSDLFKKTQVYKFFPGPRSQMHTSRSNEVGKEKREKSKKSERTQRRRSREIETCKATQVIKLFPQPRPRIRTRAVSARPIESDKAKSGRMTSTSVIKFFPPLRHETRSLTTSTHPHQKTKTTATKMPTKIIKFFPSPRKSSGFSLGSFLRTKSTKNKVVKTDRKSKHDSVKSKKEKKKKKPKVGDGKIVSVRKYYLRKERANKPMTDFTCKKKIPKTIKSQDKHAISKSCKIIKKEKVKKEPKICGKRKKEVIKKDKKNLDYKTGHRIRSVRKYYLEKLPISPMHVCTTCPMCQTKNAVLKGSPGHPGISSSSSLRGDKKSNVKKKGTFKASDKKISKSKKGPGKSKITQNNFAASVIKYIPPRRIRKRNITVNTPPSKIKSRRTQSLYSHDLKPRLINKNKAIRRRKLKRCLLSKITKRKIDVYEEKTKKTRFAKIKKWFVKFIDTQTEGQDEATCNLIGGSQKRPCQWIYDHFPSVYPAFLVLYKVYNNTVHVFFFLLAAIIWCPLFCWCFLFYFVIFRRLLCS